MAYLYPAYTSNVAIESDWTPKGRAGTKIITTSVASRHIVYVIIICKHNIGFANLIPSVEVDTWELFESMKPNIYTWMLDIVIRQVIWTKCLDMSAKC